jgi:hypothetical protein
MVVFLKTAGYGVNRKSVIVDRFGKDETPEITPTPGQRRPAACEGECTA